MYDFLWPCVHSARIARMIYVVSCNGAAAANDSEMAPAQTIRPPWALNPSLTREGPIRSPTVIRGVVAACTPRCTRFAEPRVAPKRNTIGFVWGFLTFSPSL